MQHEYAQRQIQNNVAAGVRAASECLLRWSSADELDPHDLTFNVMRYSIAG